MCGFAGVSLEVCIKDSHCCDGRGFQRLQLETLGKQDTSACVVQGSGKGICASCDVQSAGVSI